MGDPWQSRDDSEFDAVVTHTRHWAPILLICCLLSGITAAVFWPACRNGFVDWDDPFYVYNQPEILNGIGWTQLCWAATAEVAGNWHPLTLISLQLDAQLFGPNAEGFHRTSVLIHAVNATMVFLMLSSLTGSRWKSATVALLFAIHPLRVESVAWISERKDVLSCFFFA